MNKPNSWLRLSRLFSLRASSLACGSAFMSNQVPRNRTVTMTGKTDLHNYYPESWQRRDSKKSPRNYNGLFTTKRTARNAKAVAHIHARLSYGQYVYLVTHTMRSVWSDRERRGRFRLLLDRIRKEPGYVGHMWTTERHASGKLHHHCVCRFSSTWDYASKVQAWSVRYCASTNGLDIKPPKGPKIGQQAAIYVAKGFWYGIKGQGTDDALPFRWWGTSKVIRSVKVADDDLPTLFSLSSVKRWPKCAYVSARWAVELCALASREIELIRTIAPVRRSAPTRAG